MDIWSVIGIGGAVCVSIGWVPQILHAWKSKSLDDVHWSLLVLLLFGSFLWIAYGWHNGDMIVVATNVMITIFLLTLATMKKEFKH